MIAAADGTKNFMDVLAWEIGPIGWILWLLSLVTVAVIITFLISIRRGTILPDLLRQQVQGMFENRQYREVIDLTATQPDFLSHVLHAALGEAPHGYTAMERAMEEAAEERTTKLLRNIEWLNLIGNVSPMLGLMGTVAGMIGAFLTILAKGGQPEPADFAGDIGVALGTTLLGLAIAIPALAIYSFLRNRIDTLSSETMLVTQEMVSSFRPARKS